MFARYCGQLLWLWSKRGRAALQALAVDISLAALLGENIYNFGELLQHPIVSTRCCDSFTQYVLQYVPILHALASALSKQTLGMRSSRIPYRP